MHIAVIGAGITGLASAYRLTLRGHQVTLFEKENCLGGLAAGFRKENWQWYLENFFHHFFTSDKAAKKLLAELGLSDKLFYLRPKTSIFLEGKIHQFDSPISVLKFPHLSLLEKLRVGAITTYLKLGSQLPLPRSRIGTSVSANVRSGIVLQGWKNLEKTAAANWLKKYYGQKAYQLLWQPLLKAKFGPEANQISMAWFWARIKKRSARLGYLQGGFQTLIDKLAEEIKKNHGKILLGHEVESLAKHLPNFDRLIITTPSSTFLKIAPNLPKTYIQKVRKLKMIGALNLILVLEERFLTDGIYWLNINESGFPFVAVVEHTNFIHSQHYGGDHILYVGGYYPQNHRYFKMSKEQIFKEFLPYLKKINPKFKNVSRITYHVSRNLFAQPVIPIHYSRLVPKMKTPLPNVFLANMQIVYPWDRGVNYAIELGERAAESVAPS